MSKNSSHTVLIVDDDELFLRAMTAYLSQAYHVTSATSGELALRKLAQERPDLILLDISLPGMSGLELLEKLTAKWPEIPVIMVTALDHRRRKEALSLGAYGYITKPVDPEEELLPTMERALQN